MFRVGQNHRVEIVQDGCVVASVDGDDLAFVLREAAHYAAQYQQDGAVSVKAKTVPSKPARKATQEAKP